MTTDSGQWAVKQVRRDLPKDIDTAFAIELAAHNAGIPSPRPIPSRNGRCYEIVSQTPVRCHSWEEGLTKTNEEVSAIEARQMGKIVANLHGLRIPAKTQVSENKQQPFSKDHWLELATATQGRSPKWASIITTHVDDLVSIEAEVQQRRSSMDELQVGSHSDLNAHNVLFNGPLLSIIDWDGAGPQFASFERASYSVLWSQRTEGGYDEERTLAFLRGYLDAGGIVEHEDVDALWLWLHGVIWWTEQNVRLAVQFATSEQDKNAEDLLHAILRGPHTIYERQAVLRKCIRALIGPK